MNIPEEIEAFSDAEERADLLLVFDAYHWQGEWPAVARYEFVEFNSNAKRKWRLSPIGKAVAFQHRSAEKARILREALREIAGTSANENSEPDRMADALGEIQGIVHRALEATKEGA